MGKTLFAILALIFLGSATAAAARIADPLGADPGAPGLSGRTRVLVVESSRGLDLTRASGADRFLHRLALGVARGCEARAQAATDPAAAAACRRQAMALALTYVSAPLVQRRYAALSGRPDLTLAVR